MDNVEVEVVLKSAGPPGSADLRTQVIARKGFISARWANVMLRTPIPADEQSDIRAANAALAESDERISYEKVRRELGLA